MLSNDDEHHITLARALNITLEELRDKGRQDAEERCIQSKHYPVRGRALHGHERWNSEWDAMAESQYGLPRLLKSKRKQQAA